MAARERQQAGLSRLGQKGQKDGPVTRCVKVQLVKYPQIKTTQTVAVPTSSITSIR